MLKKKWRYSIIIAILVPILVIIMFTATQVLGRTESLVKTLNHTAQLILQEKITNVLDILAAISKMPRITNTELTLQERAATLHNIQEQYDFARLTLVDADGNVESALLGETTNIRDYAFFTEVKTTTHAVTSEIIIDPATNERFIIMMYPIVSDNQFLGGVLALNRLENLVDFTSVLDTDKGYQTAIVDAQSMLLDSHVEAMYELDQVIGNAKTEDMFYAWNDQRLVAVTMTKNEFLNWYIVTELDMSTYYLNFWILLLIIGATSLSTVAIIQISKRRNKVLEPLLQRLHTDDLTGISNRSYFENRVKSYLKQDHDQFDHAAFILLDLDNFKEINDRLSHLVGDQVIQETALKIHTQMRNTDVVARFGGDEFAIFMNGVRDEKAIVEKVQTLLNLLTANYSDETTTVTISVSIGITMITPETTTYEQLYVQADEALYRAKHHGRHCAVIAQSGQIIESK